jgi:murein DD-endopeptidase MepM/ murein hydrolase activator NlpD
MGQFRGVLGVAGLFALTACVPPNADTARRNAPPVLEQPKLETLYDEKPVWEARPVRASATDVNADTYVVQPGDTLTGIGSRTGAGVDTIATANGLVAPYPLQIGQRLNIPGGRFHTVTQGESGIAISRAYNVTWADIVSLNGLQEPFVLRVGQRLKLPTPKLLLPDATPDLEARAKAFSLNIEDIITGGEPALEPEQMAAAPSQNLVRPLAPNVAVATPRAFSGRFIWPVDGAIVSKFGPSDAAERNDGIEIAASLGTPIKAASDGVVAFVGNGVAGYGGLILIRHGGGWITAYGRAGEAMVTRGQSVKQGQVIGSTGDFGTTDRPQLHFQIRQGRIPVNPINHLPRGT